MFPVNGEHRGSEKATHSPVKMQKTQKTSKLRPAFKLGPFFKTF